MTSWFLSDLHLRDINERNGNTLLRFLFELNKSPADQQLFLLGDIFDVWVSDGSVFVSRFQPIIDEIVKFKNAGGRVYYFEGNHDMHIDRYWTSRHGIKVFVDPQYMPVGQLNVRMEHGDYINPEDRAYLQYLSIVRHPFVRWLGHTLPSRFWAYVAGQQSQKSRKKTARYSIENAGRIRDLIRAYAIKSFAEKPFDLMITGHMHIFDDHRLSINGREVRSINLGTWLEKPRVLKIQGAKVEVIELPVS